jgi:hypothetical protein
MKTFTKAQLEVRATQRPKGYIEDVLKYATADGDLLSLTDEDHEMLVKKYSAPGFLKQARTAGFSIKKWIEDGGKVLSDEQFDARQSVCKGCEFWSEKAMMGGGRCLKCGCSTKFKLRMPHEKCPIDKWGPVQAESTSNES